jgi:hypothetical protein
MYQAGPHTDLTLTSHWPHIDLTLTSHWPHTDLTLTSHWPHIDLTLTSHWPHTDLTLTSHPQEPLSLQHSSTSQKVLICSLWSLCDLPRYYCYHQLLLLLCTLQSFDWLAAFHLELLQAILVTAVQPSAALFLVTCCKHCSPRLATACFLDVALSRMFTTNSLCLIICLIICPIREWRLFFKDY